MKKRVIITAPVEVIIDGKFCNALCDFSSVKYCSLFRRELDEDDDSGENFRCSECLEATVNKGVVDSIGIELVNDEEFLLKLMDVELNLNLNST